MHSGKRINLLGVGSLVFIGLAVVLPLCSVLADDFMLFFFSVWAAVLCAGAALVCAVVGLVVGTLGRERERVTPALGLVGVLVLAIAWEASSPGYTDFFLFGGRYRRVVDAVREAGVPPGEERHFVLDRPWDAASLRPVGPDETDRLGQGCGACLGLAHPRRRVPRRHACPGLGPRRHPRLPVL